MGRRILIASIFSFIIWSPVTVLAFDVIGELHVGAGLGWIMPNDSDLDTAVYPVLNAGWGMDQVASVELSIGRASITGDMVDLVTIPVHFTALHRINKDSYSIYLGGGPGYYINEADSNRSNVSVRVKDIFGAHLATGFDYRIDKGMSINFDLRFLKGWTFMTVTEDVSGTSRKEDFDIDATVASIGIKFIY